MEIIQIMILLFSLFALSRVYLNIKKRNLDKLESIFWTLFWISAIIASLLPGLVVNIANLLGVDRGVDLVIYGTLVILAYLIFRIYAYQAKLERDMSKVIRTIAIKNDKRTKGKHNNSGIK